MVKKLKWSEVSLSDIINSGNRLEASVYDIDAQMCLKTIAKCGWDTKPLIGIDGFVRNAHYGDRLKRKYVSKEANNAIGFLGSAEMLDIYPKPVKFMLNNDSVDKLRVNENTILISRSGTIGNVTFVSETLAKNLVSEHAIRLECYENPGYVYTFLKSDLGKCLILSKVFGSVVQEIEPNDIATIPVPNPSDEIKKEINDKIINSYKLRDQSNELIDQATRLLYKELNLPKFSDFASKYHSDNNVDCFNVKLSNLTYRLDASYHIPLVDAILEHLSRYSKEMVCIGDEKISTDVVLPGRFKRTYVDKEYGVKFLGGKNIHQLDPATDKYLSKTAHKKQLDGALGIKEFSIITPARGSLGDVLLPSKQFVNWAISDNMMQIMSYEDVCGYVFAFLNCEYGKELIKRFTYGGVVDAIEPEHIKCVQIPLLKDDAVQSKINDIILKSNELRFDAYCLEKEAISMLEEKVFCI